MTFTRESVHAEDTEREMKMKGRREQSMQEQKRGNEESHRETIREKESERMEDVREERLL